MGGSYARAGAALSPRELEALRLAGEGLTGKQIGARMGVATGTARTYLSRVNCKLATTHKAGAVLRAIDLGVLGERPALVVTEQAIRRGASALPSVFTVGARLQMARDVLEAAFPPG